MILNSVFEGPSAWDIKYFHDRFKGVHVKITSKVLKNDSKFVKCRALTSYFYNTCVIRLCLRPRLLLAAEMKYPLNF